MKLKNEKVSTPLLIAQPKIIDDEKKQTLEGKKEES